MQNIRHTFPDNGTIVVAGGNGSLGRATVQVINKELCMPNKPAYELLAVDLNFNQDILDKKGIPIPTKLIPQLVESEHIKRYECDLADYDQVSNLVKYLKNFPPVIGVVFATLGGGATIFDWANSSIDSVNAASESLFIAAYHLTQALLPSMREGQRGGRFLNCSSTEIHYNRAGPYTSEHSRREHYFKGIASEESKNNIFTLSFRLGSLGNASNWWRFFDDPVGQLELLERQIPGGKLMSCEDVAYMFLEYMRSPVIMPIQSGSVVEADGGYHNQKGERRGS
jgi:NAD(P)-dependent dehydrogenase (short-subunit alcohol dehydrogenase family)